MYTDIIDDKSNFNNKKDTDTVIFLEDSKEINGEIKTNDWQGKKINNLELANSYKRIYKDTARWKKYINVKNCSTFLDFARHYEFKDQRKLYAANFCKDRLCPTCNWRRSLKVYAQASAVMNVAVLQEYEFIFLTLTQKNVKSEDLEDEITRMMRAFSNMTKRKNFKDAFKGFFRALEITYNKSRNDYHPHFHVILAVEKGYFNSRHYMKKDAVIKLWRECMDLDYNPSVDIQKFKSETKSELSKSLAEATKYTVKDADYLIKNKRGNLNPVKTDEVVKTLSEALFNRRLIAWGGVLKKIHKSLNLDDAENGDLVVTDKEDEFGGFYIIERYRWSVGMRNYVLTETFDLRDRKKK